MTGEWPTGARELRRPPRSERSLGGPDATWRAAFSAGVVLDELITGILRLRWARPRGGFLDGAVGDILEHEDQ